jgi:hypothetical protein
MRSAVRLATTLKKVTNLLLAGSWTMSVVGGTSTATESPAGTLNLTGDATNAARGDQSFTTVVGKSYRLTLTEAGAFVQVSIGNSQGGTGILNGAVQTVGERNYDFVATATTTWVRISRTNNGLAQALAISCKLIAA